MSTRVIQDYIQQLLGEQDTPREPRPTYSDYEQEMKDIKKSFDAESEVAADAVGANNKFVADVYIKPAKSIHGAGATGVVGGRSGLSKAIRSLRGGKMLNMLKMLRAPIQKGGVKTPGLSTLIPGTSPEKFEQDAYKFSQSAEESEYDKLIAASGGAEQAGMVGAARSRRDAFDDELRRKRVKQAGKRLGYK